MNQKNYIFASFLKIIDNKIQFKGLDQKEKVSILLGLSEFL